MGCCEYTGGMQVLARYCPGCGKTPSAAAYGADSFHLRISHCPETLIWYLGAVLVFDTAGTLQVLNPRLEPVCSAAAPLPEGESTPVACEGFLYVPAKDGLYQLDLVAAAQQRNVAVRRFSSAQMLSPLHVHGGHVYGVSGKPSPQLVACDQSGVCATFPLPVGVAGAMVFEPVIMGQFAFVTRQNSTVAWIVNLHSAVVTECALGGQCVATATGPNGMAFVITCGASQRIVEITATGVSVRLPKVSNEATWLRFASTTNSFLWGNGASVTVQTNHGPRLIEERGNIAAPVIAGSRAVAIMQDSIKSFVVVIDAASGAVREMLQIGEYGYSHLAAGADRVVAGNGTVLMSIAVKG